MIINIQSPNADEIIDEVIQNYSASLPVADDSRPGEPVVGSIWLIERQKSLIVLDDVRNEYLELWKDKDILFAGLIPVSLDPKWVEDNILIVAQVQTPAVMLPVSGLKSWTTEGCVELIEDALDL